MPRLLILAVLAFVGLPSFAFAQELALKRVMLSSGGLGYFEYEAQVDGDATLKLTVSLDQVDDVLKSLVVYDDKGGVGGLSLPGKEPLRQAFKDLPFDQSALESPADLLGALKGAEVSVRGSRAMVGRIVSVAEEQVTSTDGKGIGKRTRVALFTDHGLEQFILEDAEDLQFTDSALRDKIAKALLAIQANRARESRTLDLSARGQGKRTIRVAYIVTVPVWKASYRLTLPADGQAPKVALQGWATVENMSGQDWKDVELTLVSGRPIAFHQALYEAYYVSRPEVPVEVAGRLNPYIDRGGVEAQNVKRADSTFSSPPPPAPAAAPPLPKSTIMGLPAGASMPMAGNPEQIQATDAATQVVFKFPRSVNVANGRTLSIPMIDRELPGQRLALFQSDSSQRNPMAAVRLTNDGDTGLPPGILTIYERGKDGSVAYVGDARLSGFPIGEQRLLAYALDEKITVERDATQSSRLATGSISDGVLHYSRIVRQATAYRVRGPAKEPRQLVILQRRLPGWNLTKPDAKGIEISEGNYRLPFQLPGGDQTQLAEVVQEQTQQQEVRLLDGGTDQIKVFAQAQEFDAKTREALTKILQLQQAVADADRKAKQIDAERQQIVQEQSRLRENLKSVPANSDLQRRYLTTLDKQETELEAFAKQHADAQKAVETARSALRSYVTQLG
ncbi:MAG TPA: DUF4139 domain-containing protein [Reyranella sp.]|nr:DUF4139 domain-containing protein [Reyranella sp.]